MAPKKGSASEAAESPTGLTDGELRFIKAVFDNMTQKPDANWNQVAADLGLKDAKCAKERFRQMSVRHGWRDGTGGGGGGGGVASPRKARAAATGPAGDAKVKKTRSPRKQRAVPAKKQPEEVGVKQEEVEAEEAEEAEA